MKKSDAVLYIGLAGVGISALALGFTQGWIKNPFEKKGSGSSDGGGATPKAQSQGSSDPSSTGGGSGGSSSATPPAPEVVPAPLAPQPQSLVSNITNSIGQGAHQAITSGLVSSIPVVGAGISTAYNFIQGLVGEEKKAKAQELYERFKSLGNDLEIREEVRDGRDGWLGLIPVRRAMMVARNKRTGQELAAETYSRNA